MQITTSSCVNCILDRLIRTIAIFAPPDPIYKSLLLFLGVQTDLVHAIANLIEDPAQTLPGFAPHAPEPVSTLPTN